MAADRSPDDASRRGRDVEEAALKARLRELGERISTLSPKPKDPDSGS